MFPTLLALHFWQKILALGQTGISATWKTKSAPFTFSITEDSLGPAVDLLTENLLRAGICTHVEQRPCGNGVNRGVGQCLVSWQPRDHPTAKKLKGVKMRFNREVKKRLADKTFTVEEKTLVRYKLTPRQAEFVNQGMMEMGFDYTEPSNGNRRQLGKKRDGRGAIYN